MKWTIKKIIRDTVQFFGADPKNNRCVEDNGSGNSRCMYTDSQDRHCAIGRFLLPEHQTLEFAEEHINENVEHLNEDRCLDEMLVLEARGFPINFWNDLQMLHDGDNNWEKTGGLSDRGESFYHGILSKYIIGVKE